MRKLKILQVNKLYYPHTGGIEKVVKQISEGLSQKYDIKVLCCELKRKGKLEIINGIKVYKAGSFGRLFSLPISISFIFYFKKLSRNSDIIHLHMPFPLGDIAYLLSNYKGKLVIWWHSDIIRQKRLLLLYNPIMKKILDKADVIIVSSYKNIIYSPHLQNYKRKCVVIPFGINQLWEKKSEEYMLKSKSNLKSKNSNTTFLFVGRLVYYKGCDILINAFKYIENCNLIIVGNGPLKNKIKHEILQNNLQNKVHLYSNISDENLHEFFQKSDVFVFPSTERSEAFGLVQLEAMSYGLPVINTNLSTGVPTVSIDGVTGITIEPHNVVQLIEALEWMKNHPNERKILGENARKHIKKFYQEKVMIERIEKIYNSLIDNNINNK